MDHSGDSGAQELADRVGRLVRAERERQRLSASALAERAGLSRTILGKIEAGDGNPSISTLWRLSKALSVSLGDLLGEPDAPRTRVIRTGDGDPIGDPSGMVARLLHAAGREGRSEVFAIDLPAGTRRESQAHYAGVEELIVITKGRAEVGRDDDPATLATGDAMWFASDVPHHYAALGSGACHLLCWMLYPPTTT
ncbi:MAG: XRE family transcriptional regulator [Solirubrobacteraceae bacterium]|nr:XRE family transcriptional regulator [Patulibacter sp.]